MLADEDVQKLKQEYAFLGMIVTDEFVKHFHDYTEDEIKDLELYIQRKLNDSIATQ
jgi:hypothetical protein